MPGRTCGAIHFRLQDRSRSGLLRRSRRVKSTRRLHSRACWFRRVLLGAGCLLIRLTTYWRNIGKKPARTGIIMGT